MVGVAENANRQLLNKAAGWTASGGAYRLRRFVFVETFPGASCLDGAQWGGCFAASSERRARQPAGHHLEVITHHSKSHGRADAMAIARGNGQQKILIAPALPAEDSLTNDRVDEGARIVHGQPQLARLSLTVRRVRLR